MKGKIDMKKRTKKGFIITFIIITLTVGGVAFFINWAFYDIQRIDGQEYLDEIISPKGTYTVTAYLKNGGATTDYAVLCTTKNNKNGKTKNIYWQNRIAKADMEWLSDENIKINGIILNVKKETYDYRRN